MEVEEEEFIAASKLGKFDVIENYLKNGKVNVNYQDKDGEQSHSQPHSHLLHRCHRMIHHMATCIIAWSLA